MAVQSQYPCNFVLLNRSEREKKEMDFPQAAPGFLDSSALLFASRAVVPNPRKRGGEVVGVPVAPPPPQQSHPVNIFSLQPQPCSTPLPPPAILSLAQVQSHPPPLVSTGLHLSLEEQYQQQNQNQSNPLVTSSSSSLLSSLLSEELAARINQQKEEIEQLLRAQGEQLRRGVAETRRSHYRSLLGAAKESAERRLREKEAEVERAARRSAELEDRLARLRTESMAWRAKAMANRATAASLQAQLHQVAAAAAAAPQARGNECGEAAPAEDAESAFVDPERVEAGRACRACWGRLASVVLLPCRHLCLCDACDGGGESCPVCRCVKAGSVRVFLA